MPFSSICQHSLLAVVCCALYDVNPPLYCIFSIFAQNFVTSHLNSSLLKNVDSFIDSRLHTDVDLHRGDNNVTVGSFHLGCCAGVSCGPPLHVANGVVRGAVFQFGDVALYSCFGGYTMEGIGRSRCLENGTWTTPPTCRGRESMIDRRDPLSFSPSLSFPLHLLGSSALLWTPPALPQRHFTKLSVLLLPGCM